MSLPLHPGYRFATEAQWQACLFAGADRTTAESRNGLRPFAPYGVPPSRFETQGAHAPALSDAAEVLWRDDGGRLQRLPYGDVAPHTSPAPAAIGSANRMVATPGSLWTVGQDGTLQGFDIESLTRLFSVDLGGLDVVDFAGDGRDGVYALIASKRGRQVVHVDCAGQVDASMIVEEPADATALVFLGQPAKLVLLGSDGSKLYTFDPEGGRPRRIVLISALRLCFDVIAMGSDGCARVFLAGRDGAAGAGHQVVMIDSEGNPLGTVPVGEAPTGLVANRSQLFVTTVGGLLRFDPATTVPQGAGEIRAAVLTPLLRSPSRIPQRWLRVEARVALPPGCAIEISYVATDEPEVQERMLSRLADASARSARRLDDGHRALARRTFVFHGDAQFAPGEEVLLSAPLHDVGASLLRVHVALIATPGGRVPRLSELSVLYPGPTLIEHLPAIYRTSELESGDFLRAVVGVLEAGTQELDARIDDLGRNIHAASAGDDWLDYLAGWLGLPWDNALSLDQKRRIASRAAAIASGYGTRAGLETLLDCLIPERPRRFRIVDSTTEFGIATVGGDGCEGSPLPAILSGLSKSASELGNKAILGRARLPCGEPEKETARFLGRICIDVAASAEERLAWSPWLGMLVDSMLPATVRAELRWLGPNAFIGAERLRDGLSLESEPLARLGTDSVTGAARLGGRKRTMLPGQLSEDYTLY